MNVDITGIRYQFPGTREEQTAQAEGFLRSLAYPQPVTLKAEPDNVFDEKAVAVYMNFRHIGYISSPTNEAILPLLDPCWGTLEASLTGHDGHVTAHCFVDDQGQGTPLPAPQAERQLTASPIVREDALPIAPEENGWELLGQQLLTHRYKDDEAERLLDDLEHYLAYPIPSLCKADQQALSLLTDNIRLYRAATYISENPACRERMKALCQRLSDQAGDFHTVEGCCELLTAHMALLQGLAQKPGSLFERFEQRHFGQRLKEDTKSKAPIHLVTKELMRLQKWLNGIDCNLFDRDAWDMNAIATALSYKRLTRREMYDVESVMLLIDHLRPFATIHRLSPADLAELTELFKGNEDHALAFLEEIQYMSNVEKVDRVAQGVNDGEISKSKFHHDLWHLLNRNGLYTPSESNWNDQLARKDLDTYSMKNK